MFHKRRNILVATILLVWAGFFALWIQAAQTNYERRVQGIDHAGNTSSFTDPWEFSVVEPLMSLTVTSIPTFRQHSNDYSTTGDMRLLVQSGSTRTQIHNSFKNLNQTGVSIWSSGTGQFSFSGGMIRSGDTYLVVYKPRGGLSIGYTGIWLDTITGFDFTMNNPNIYPRMQYGGVSYTKLWDVEFDALTRRDYINEFDLAEINYNLQNMAIERNSLYDFDGNSTTNVIEQSAVTQFDSQRWCIEQYTVVTPIPGLSKTDFY